MATITLKKNPSNKKLATKPAKAELVKEYKEKLGAVIDAKAKEKAVFIAADIASVDLVERLRALGLEATLAAVEAAFPGTNLTIDLASDEAAHA